LELDRPPDSMTVTIQKELAERISARPHSKDYGALSLWVQCQCRVEILRTMPPSVFWPRPNVDSAIIHIAQEPQRREAIPDRRFFHQFVRTLFLHRRKFLRGVLASAYKDYLDKPAVDQILAELQFSPAVRAEEIEVDQMLALSEKFRTRLPTTPVD